MSIERGVSPIEVYRGDTPRFRYQVSDVDEQGNKTPVNLSNYKLKGQVRYSPDDSLEWFSLPIVITDAAEGRFEWKITKQMTDEYFSLGSYQAPSAVYDIQMMIGSGDSEEIFTFLTGSFLITSDVTR